MNTVLSEEGIRQAQLVGIKLQNEDFSHVFSSDLSRAQKTAEAIVSRNNCCSQRKIVEDYRLRERGYGAAEGCSKQRFFQMAAKESVKPSNFVPEGAETLTQVSERVLECFNTILHETGNSHLGPYSHEQNGSCVSHKINNGFLYASNKGNGDCNKLCLANVLIVSHGGVIRQLINHFFTKVKSEFPVKSRSISMVSPNTGVSRFEIFLNEKTNLPEFVRCICLHDIEHLKDTPQE